MRAPNFWHRRALYGFALAPLGGLYRIGSWARQAWATPWHAPVPVLCVGNIVAGGAGKTPLVLYLAQVLRSWEIDVHVISRGYGSTASTPTRVDPAQHNAGQVGDEPLLIARYAPCWVGKNRRAVMQAALDAGARLLLLDDGFQNPNIHKNFAFIVIDGEYGIGNGQIMPAGPLREPFRTGMRRAGAVVMIGEDRQGLTAQVPRHVPVYQASMQPQASMTQTIPYIAFAGIGRPEKFFATLEALGLALAAVKAFPDHHAFSEKDLVMLKQMAAEHQARLITTEKDAVRLPAEWRAEIDVLPVALEIHPRAAFDSLLASLSGAAKMHVHESPEPIT